MQHWLTAPAPAATVKVLELDAAEKPPCDPVETYSIWQRVAFVGGVTLIVAPEAESVTSLAPMPEALVGSVCNVCVPV